MATDLIGSRVASFLRHCRAAALMISAVLGLATAPASAAVVVTNYASVPGSGYSASFTLTYDDSVPYSQDATIYTVSNFTLALPAVTFTNANVRNLSPGLISLEKTCIAFLPTCFNFRFEPAATSQGATVQYQIFGIGASERGTIDQVGSVVSGVPEPSTWLMMLFGVGMIGACMRKRRGNVGRALAFTG